MKILEQLGNILEHKGELAPTIKNQAKKIMPLRNKGIRIETALEIKAKKMD